MCAYMAEGTSNTRLIFPQPIRFGRDSSPVQHMKCSGFSLFSVWHTIKLYLEEIQFFYKSCISINCVLPLFPIHVQRERALHGFQSHSHLNITFHLYMFQLSKPHSVWKKAQQRSKVVLPYYIHLIIISNFSEKSSRHSFNVKAILPSF